MSGDPERKRVLYGRRSGRRLRAGKRQLLSDLLPKTALPMPMAGDRALDGLFRPGVDRVWLEIGFGGGEHLAWQAEANPDVGIIGCEPFINGVANLLKQIDDRGLDNVRIHADDARDLLETLPDACLDRVFILFPDPWPKARHHRRRIVAPATLEQLARIMRPGTELRLATDHADYGRWMLRHLIRHPAFQWRARRPADWQQRPEDWPATRYEAKAIAAGRACLYLSFERTP